jgi:hypothetical protein
MHSTSCVTHCHRVSAGAHTHTGGAVSLGVGAEAVIIDSTFDGNVADWPVVNPLTDLAALLEDATFDEMYKDLANNGVYSGGAIVTRAESGLWVSNSVFTRNSADISGETRTFASPRTVCRASVRRRDA